MSSTKCHSVVAFADARPGAVTKLPPEILTRIFDIFSSKYVWRTRAEEWTTVTHVCRLWRSVALRDPSLWTYLDESLPLSWMDEYLLRSDPLPVQLSCSFMGSQAAKNRLCAIIWESSHRLGTLMIDQRDGRGRNILASVQRPAPALTELTLWAGVDTVNSVIPKRIFGGHIPRLSKLSLSSVIMPLRASWLSNIRDLQLEGLVSFYDADVHASVPVNVNTLINLLESLPNLESFHLDVPDDAVFSEIPVAQNYDHQVSLVHLKKASFYLREPGIALTDIFNHISLVAPIGLILHLDLDSVDADRMQTACRFFLKNTSRSHYSFTWGEYRIAVAPNSPYPILHELSFLTVPAQRSELLTLLSKHLIPFVEIRTLRVCSPHPGWLIFSGSETIEKLEISNAEALSLFLLYSYTSFPCLRHLDVSRCDISSAISMLLPWLIGRQSSEAKLEELALSSIIAIEEEHLASLRCYVAVSIETLAEV